MSQELLSQIQVAIDKAKTAFLNSQQIITDKQKAYMAAGFDDGTALLLPLLEEAMDQRDDAVGNWEHMSAREKLAECNNFDKRLLNMLGEKK